MTAAVRRFLIMAAVVAAAFLAGFMLQYAKAGNLSRELEASRARLDACETSNRAAGLRDLMGLAYLEVNRKNYGLAAEHASRFFERAREARPAVREPGMQAALDEALAERDAIVAGLARGDGAVQETIQKVYARLLEAARQ